EFTRMQGNQQNISLLIIRCLTGRLEALFICVCLRKSAANGCPRDLAAGPLINSVGCKLEKARGTTMPSEVATRPEVTLADFQEAARHVSAHAYHPPLLTSRLLSEHTGFDVRLKAEIFQRGGSYKVRGPLNKFRHLTPEQRQRGVICSSAGNHAQGVAIAAGVYKMKAVVVMASNATQSKVDATRAYGAEVVQYGNIWDEANEKSRQLCQERGLTYIHPFDDMQLITGQGTLGLEVFKDFPQIDVAVVPI